MEIPPTNRPITCSRSATKSLPTPLWKSKQARQRREERDHDGDPAQPGDRVSVNLAGRAGVVERPETVGQPPDERRQRRPAQHREDEGDRCGSHSGGRVRTQFPSASTSIRVLR